MTTTTPTGDGSGNAGPANGTQLPVAAESAGPVGVVRSPAYVDVASPADGQVVTGVLPNSEAGRQSVKERLRRRRFAVIMSVIGVCVLAVFVVLAERTMFSQRQIHLAAAIAKPKPNPKPGDPIAVLQAESIGMNLVVVEGAGAGQLRSGPGRVAGTAGFGGSGDIVVIAHRSRYGGPFARLARLRVGDEIVVRTQGGLVREYKVTSTEQVRNQARLSPPRGTERLVLVTSGPGYLGPGTQRVVTAEATPGQTAVANAASGGSQAFSLRSVTSRPLPALTAVAVLAVLIAAGVGLVLAALELRRRNGTVTAIAVGVPGGLFLAVLSIYALDLVILPTL